MYLIVFGKLRPLLTVALTGTNKPLKTLKLLKPLKHYIESHKQVQYSVKPQWDTVRGFNEIDLNTSHVTLILF